jgi:DNA topoisomerase-1
VPARKKPSSKAAKTSATGRKKAAPATVSKASPAKKPRAVSKGTNGKFKQDLVIVESPAKAKTINKYLGPNYKVLASYGHVRDLPKRRRRGEIIAGVNIDEGWVPTYVVPDKEELHGNERAGRRRTPKEILAELKREVAKSNRVFLATDPDREGEAIAWHIEDALKLDDERTFRISFNEITRSAVQNALTHAGKIDMDRVQAQEARRILDRVVGYPLSNLLNRKIARQLSAGRVQSVALRLVVDREREIEAFKPEEYWKITALLALAGAVPGYRKELAVALAKVKGAEATDGETPEVKEEKQAPPAGSFPAELALWAGQKFAAATQDQALAIATALDTATYAVTKIEQKDRQEKAPPPFTTSTLQQQANIRLHFHADRTMRTAQRLYEGVDLGPEGSVALITYMRTDSTRVSNEALQAVRDHIGTKFGPAYLPAKPNTFVSGKSAQEAHEAIRPTDLSFTPERVAQLGLHGDQWKLYTLIYNRFVASQMTPAVFAVTNVEITATPMHADLVVPAVATIADATTPASGLFKVQGKILKFDGYRRVLPPGGKQEDATLPALTDGAALDRLELNASQHFTQPPPRYNEASLIRALEKEGIGRPSTYASILHKITSDKRRYIEVKDRRFYATETGKRVTDLLVEHFPNVMDMKFTSQMEEELDQIETRQTQKNHVLSNFYGPFSEALKVAEAKMPASRGIETGEMCPLCGKPLVKNYSKKTGREFVGCSGFKEGCKYIKPGEGDEAREAPVETEFKCPTCGKTMLQRKGPRGPFLGCSGYPDCKTKMNFDAEGNPVLAAVPTEHKCEKCGRDMVIRQGPRGPFLACTGFPKCRNAKDVDAEGNPVKPVESGIACEKCRKPMIIRRGPRGPFLGCSDYPKCKTTMRIPEEMKDKVQAMFPPREKKPVPHVEIHENCPKCGSPMKLRAGGRKGYFLGCSTFPKCRGAMEAPPEVMDQIQAATAATPS